MGRARSRRRRGLSGGQGAGKGKGTGSGKGNGSGKGTGGSKGRSRHNRGGQHNANKNQNEKAKKTVSKLGLGKIGKKIGKGFLGTAVNKIAPGLGLLGKALSHPTIGAAIAQGFVNSPHASDYNKLQRDKSKLTPQQLRQVERWEQKTGRDWEKRKEVGRINLSMDQIARFAKLDQNDWKSKLYNALPSSIRNARVDKTFYGTEKKKGWHPSQRPGRGHGVKDGFDFGPEFLIDQKTPEARNNFLKIIRAQGTPYAKDNFLKQIRAQPKQPPVMAKPLPLKPLPLPMPRDLSGDDNPKNIPKAFLPTIQPAVPPSNSLNNFLKIIRR